MIKCDGNLNEFFRFFSCTFEYMHIIMKKYKNL